MVNKDISDVSISCLEKLIINWATPFEGLYLWPMIKSGCVPSDAKNRHYFDSFSVFEAIYRLKNDDYQRLIMSSSDDGLVPDAISKLYDKSMCGRVMKLTYQNLR